MFWAICLPRPDRFKAELGDWFLLKNVWARVDEAGPATVRPVGLKLCRVGATGAPPWSICPWRSVASLIGAVFRGTRPLPKFWAETVVMPRRTLALV